MSTLAKPTQSAATHPPSDTDHRADFADRAGSLGLEIADITGIVEELSELGGDQVAKLKAVVSSAREAAETNGMLATSMEDARLSADQTRVILSESANLVANTLASSIEKMQVLSEGVFNTMSSLTQVRETIAKVQAASAAIQAISFETQLIALNAGVEAARAGEAGHGFAVISKAIRQLAEQVGSFADQNGKHLSVLQATLERLDDSAQDNVKTAQSAIETSKTATGTTRRLQSLVTSVEQLTDKIEAMTDPVRRNLNSGSQVRDNLKGLVSIVKQVDGQLAIVHERAENILGISEDFMLFIAASGIETPDSPIIAACQETAREISSLFENAVTTGEISMSALFDEAYRPIPETNPEQCMTRFTTFTDRVLPPIQERVLTLNPRIGYCVTIDRNGYVPTHNTITSKPQGPDPVWNAAHCRNRRMFDDRTGLGAGQNERPFLLQTYRRNMGNGNFILMKDVSAPVTVHGQHWGGLRVGYKA